LFNYLNLIINLCILCLSITTAHTLCIALAVNISLY